MSRYDKYDPISGGFRAPLAADWLNANKDKVVCVSLNASGQVVVGTAGQSGFVGVVCITQGDVGGVPTKRAGDVVDVMQHGEIVEFLNAAGAAAVAGTKYYAVADGTYDATAPGAGVNKPLVGWTVELDRLIVRCQLNQG